MAYPPLPLQTDLASPGTLPLLLVLAGLSLSLAEAIVPGMHFVVLGVALLVARLADLPVALLTNPIILRLFVFIFGALTLYGYRELDICGGKGKGRTGDPNTLTDKMGHVMEHVMPISGEVKLDEGGFNPYYVTRSVHGELEAGTEVVVIDPGGGNVMAVEGVDPGEDEIDHELTRERARRHEESVERDEEKLEHEGTGGV